MTEKNNTSFRAYIITIIFLTPMVTLATFFLYESFYPEEYVKDSIKEQKIMNEGNVYRQTMTIKEYEHVESSVMYIVDAEARLCYISGHREITVSTIPCSNLARKKGWNKIIDW